MKSGKKRKYKKALQAIVNYRDAFATKFIMNHQVKKYALKTANDALGR